MRYAIHLHHSFRHLREQHEHSLRQQRGVLLGSLAGGIAHEFNNINAAILGHAELLAGVAGDDAQARRHLGVITSSISRSSGIINGIRQLAEQSGRGRCSLSEVMTNVLMLHGPRLQRHGVQVDGVEHLPEVRLTIDAGSLTTVLTQIIQNALHAMLGRPGGRLTCAATLDGPWCRLRIGDDGVGMDADQLARATEPFVSYKGPFDRGGVYPREVGGAGLGLAVCRRLLEACDGDLGIVSHPGSGTQVEISIPLASGEDSSYQALPILRPGVDPASLRVVVADDQAVLRRLLAAMIGDLGCQVQSVTALDALVEVCAQQLPDVLVLDWYLGEADGFQVVAALRRCCAVDKLNLVVCSASPPLRREVAELGFASHHILAKPVSRQDLQACLMAIAGGHRTRRS